MQWPTNTSMISKAKYLLPVLLLLCLPPCTYAEAKTPAYDQINLTAQASVEVENDTLIAVLYAQMEGDDLGALTNDVNQQITAAVQLAKQTNEIKLQTLSYQTTPVYHQQRLSGWRVKQSIRLESRQDQELSELLSQLQTSLALESISYTVSPDRHNEIEERLIGEAIREFQQRAQLVTNKLGRKTYRLVEMTINTQGQVPRPMRMRAAMMATESSVSAPTLEAGSQILSVSINGRIELQID